LGLIEALANFDASRGLSFTTFAAPRIRGAMLDELRRLDRVPRSVRRRSRAIASATSALTGELGTAPNAQQVAVRLGVDRNTLYRWQCDSGAAQPVSLTEESDADSDEASVESAVDDAMTRKQEITALRDALLALSSRERTVLTLYFYEELRLHQIAEVLGVTESRVSQIRTQAIARLRDKLGRLREPELLRGAVATQHRRSPAGALRSA
jgi:RNA polymerase sigma factor for flagellar operon FliA